MMGVKERGGGIQIGRRGGAMETRRRIKPRGRAGCSLTAGAQQPQKHGLEEGAVCSWSSTVHRKSLMHIS